MNDLARENVQSYSRPQMLEPVPQRIMLRLGGDLVAETTRALRVQKAHHAPTYYLPLQDPRHLRPVQGSSFCKWEGRCALFRRAGGVCDSLPRRLSL